MSRPKPIPDRPTPRCQFAKSVAVAMAFLGLIAGCGKRASQTPAAPPSADQAAAAPAPAEAAPAASAPFVPRVVNPQTAVADSEAALKAKDYEAAAATILAAQQQKNLTDAQGIALRNQMVRLQGSLVTAIANGDPKAKAAAELLRASSRQ
jgi:hypothetical protein